MQVYTQLITFTTAPVALSITDSQSRPVLRACRIYAEPATSNAHDCFVEVDGVATGASGSTAGVIKRIAAPIAANTAGAAAVDHWDLADQNGLNRVDLTQYQFDGTGGEKLRVTVFVE
jgi:hypothetical protein